jgi:hypothetical protein
MFQLKLSPIRLPTLTKKPHRGERQPLRLLAHDEMQHDWDGREQSAEQ